MTSETLTATQTGVKSTTGVLPILCALVLGLGLIAVTGHVQAAALHDAAHDTRHANGFPCH